VRRLRELRPGIRVLLVSGYAGTTAIPAGTLDGDTAFLMKPFSIADLSRMIKQQLAGAASTNAEVRHAPIGPVNGAERPHRWAPPMRAARRNWLPDLALPLGNEAA
jgi:DNA-binding NtrC family response regulator